MNEEILVVICFILFVYLVYNKLQNVVINDNKQLISQYSIFKTIQLEEINELITNHSKFETIDNELSDLDTYYTQLIKKYNMNMKTIIKNEINNITNTQLSFFKTLEKAQKITLFNNIIPLLINKIKKKKKYSNKIKNIHIRGICNNSIYSITHK